MNFGGIISRTTTLNNSKVFNSIYLVIVGLLFSGNIVFTLFHKQKRGLHDIFFGAFMVTNKTSAIEKPVNFAFAPVTAGAVFFAFLAFIFGSLFLSVKNNPDFADILNLDRKIKAVSSVKNVYTQYSAFTSNGGTIMSIILNVYMPNKQNTNEYRQSLSDELFPKIKEQNQNTKISRIEIIYHWVRYLGAFPIELKTNDIKKMDEIKI